MTPIQNFFAYQLDAKPTDPPVPVRLRVPAGPDGEAMAQAFNDWLAEKIRAEFPSATKHVVDSGKGRING
ncbi:MAG: hypothetical protein AAF674_16740 [Pseudomonadota bacterium]